MPQSVIYTVLAAALLAGTRAMPQDIDALSKRATASHATDAGRAYGNTAVATFLKDASLMRDCAPPNATRADNLIVFFEVTKGGEMKNLVILPKSKAAECVRSHVAGRHFPPPPAAGFEQKINLAFKP
jgi:hypothetical protein